MNFYYKNNSNQNVGFLGLNELQFNLIYYKWIINFKDFYEIGFNSKFKKFFKLKINLKYVQIARHFYE